MPYGFDMVPENTGRSELSKRETMMKRLCLMIPFALAACNSSPTVTATNASASDVAAKVAAAQAGGQFVSPAIGNRP